jgi:hypothetical protein
MGGKFSVTLFGRKITCEFKGTDLTVNKKIEGFFETVGIEGAKHIFKGDVNLQGYFN